MKKGHSQKNLLVILLGSSSLSLLVAENGEGPNGRSSQPQVVQQDPAGSKKSSAGGPLTWQDTPRSAKDADITTINEQQGNWFKKAQLFKKASKAYAQLRKVLLRIQPLEDSYAQERQAIDAQLNLFYQEYGFQTGEADEHLDTLLADIKRLEDQTGALDPEEQQLLDLLKKKKEEIEAVKKDFSELRRLDDELSKALNVLSAQINLASQYDEQAYQHHEEIESTLSDELAQNLLNEVNNALDNVGGIEVYLNKEFKPFFKKSIDSVTAYMDKVKANIVSLKEAGIALGKKMTDLLAKEEAAKKEQQERERAAIKKEIKQAQRTVWQKIGDSISSIWQSIKNGFLNAFNFVKSFFVSEQKPVQPLAPTAATTPTVSSAPSALVEPVRQEPTPAPLRTAPVGPKIDVPPVSTPTPMPSVPLTTAPVQREPVRQEPVPTVPVAPKPVTTPAAPVAQPLAPARPEPTKPVLAPAASEQGPQAQPVIPVQQAAPVSRPATPVATATPPARPVTSAPQPPVGTPVVPAKPAPVAPVSSMPQPQR